MESNFTIGLSMFEATTKISHLSKRAVPLCELKIICSYFVVLGLDEFQRDCIRQHNIYRHQHRACRLVWSEDLAKASAAWADHLASTNTLEHSSDKDHGENLASAKGYELRGDKVAEMWYDEIQDYNFEIPAFNAKCGHFTQMIWKDTKEFGVAKSVAADGSQYVVARYHPPGNVVGEFKNCIRRARGQRSSVRKRRRSSARRRISQTDGVDPVSQQGIGHGGKATGAWW